MRSLVYAAWPSYAIAFLVPTLNMEGIQKEYLDRHGIPTDDVQLIPLHYTGKKTSKTEQKQFIEEELVPHLKDAGTSYLVVCDAEYFKTLTGQVKAEPNLGYVRDCLFGPWKVLYAPNHRSIFYDPDSTRAKIKQAMGALLAHVKGEYADPGTGIIAFEGYPDTVGKIQYWLERLLRMDKPLSIDIETFDLKHHKAGIGTISFAWSKHEGISFAVDYEPIPGATEAPYGRQVRNEPVRKLLRSFFERYTQRALYYNISFDVYVLVYQLYMNDLLDTEGMLKGMEILLRNWDCGKLITYLATNSCAGNKLSLKDQGQKFAGNYAQTEIEDITKIPLETLRRYNLVDSLTAWYVEQKHWPTLVKDQQLDIYQNLFQPAIRDIIQMQLTGLPLSMEQVKRVQIILTRIRQNALDTINQTRVVREFTYRMNERWVEEKNATLKKKRVTLADAKEEFNPNSGPQLQELLYEMLGLPVLDLTDTKLPATGGKTLAKLIHHTTDQDVLAFLQALIDFKAVDKILVAFIPAFLDAAQGPDGWYYLFGNFNLGGTVSGRLSSNNPNLQNLPSNTEMVLPDAILALFPELAQFIKDGKLNLGKLIKSCFEAPPGWIFCGLDFASLEDRISALTTKDPNKLKVYTDGYDGHSLRAFAYFGDEMPDIVDTVESINSIQTKYKRKRQDSKAPTFALQYRGTWKTLMNNCGFSEEKAKRTAARYHQLYVVSDQWVDARLKQAGKDGYITAAFGLRVRTPLLRQTVLGSRKTPFEAEAESRTAGNALGQSWGLLNTRAGVEFNSIVRAGEHRLDIKPCAQIHDAQYFLIRDNAKTVLYTNTHLVKAVEWQDHPEIWHDEVHLGGTFSIFWPTWANDIEIPNGADEATLYATLHAKLEVKDEYESHSQRNTG